MLMCCVWGRGVLVADWAGGLSMGFVGMLWQSFLKRITLCWAELSGRGEPVLQALP